MSADLFAPFVKTENADYLDAMPTSSRFAKNESYATLVWRKLRRSVTGMIGLILVALLLLTAVFADFVAPVEPKTPFVSYAPPDAISFFSKNGFSLRPVTFAMKEGTELDPVTFQPLIGQTTTTLAPLAFLSKAMLTNCWA